MKVNVGCNSLTMSELAQICGGMLCCVGGEVNKNLPFRTVCTDSREAERGSLFVALGGERVELHAVDVEPHTLRQRVDRKKSGVVAGVAIFLAGVAKPNDQPADRLLGSGAFLRNLLE